MDLLRFIFTDELDLTMQILFMRRNTALYLCPDEIAYCEMVEFPKLKHDETV